jgi:hypothetical protein
LAPNQGRATEFIGILNIERFNKRILWLFLISIA